jgi:hypothetical protein
LLLSPSNPIHTALPQPSSSPVILNNTHKTNSHLLHKNIEILAAKAAETVKPSRQEHPKTHHPFSTCASSLRHKRQIAEQGLRNLFRVWGGI